MSDPHCKICDRHLETAAHRCWKCKVMLRNPPVEYRNRRSDSDGSGMARKSDTGSGGDLFDYANPLSFANPLSPISPLNPINAAPSRASDSCVPAESIGPLPSDSKPDFTTGGSAGSSYSSGSYSSSSYSSSDSSSSYSSSDSSSSSSSSSSFD